MANIRTPRRLQIAMEQGFLNARCAGAGDLLRTYGFWCWRMALPMVWVERITPHSRFSRVRLDLFTTPFQLSVSGQAALIALSAQIVPAQDGSISAHEATWKRVPNRLALEFARAVFRVVRRPASYQRAQAAIAMKPRLAAS